MSINFACEKNSLVERSQPLDENALEAENRPFVEDVEDEVEAVSSISKSLW